MRKTRDGRRRFSREFKLGAIKRVQKGEKQIAVARDLGIGVELLSRWRKKVRVGGEEGLKEMGRQPRIAENEVRNQETRVAELERLVGKQQAEIRFLEQALHRVEELRRKKRDDGVKASSE